MADLQTGLNTKRSAVPLGKTFFRDFLRYRWLLVMLLPAVVWYIVFCYIPMAGTVLAFKSLDYSLGIFGSPWVGLANFEYFFSSRVLEM